MKNPFAVRPRVGRRGPRPRVRNRFRPADERLETRDLMSGAATLGPLDLRIEAEPNDTMDVALDLGNLNVAPAAGADGTVGAGTADVDWYRFQLDRPAHVRLDATGQPSDDPTAVVLGLYNSHLQAFGDDPTPRLGYRLLAQVDGGTGGDAGLRRDLGPGTYYAAVSGTGNRYFHPFLADSGLEGRTGAYRLQVTATDRNQDAEDGPIVLAVDRDAAPFVLRVDLGSPVDPSRPVAAEPSPVLDPNSIDLGTTVRLVYNPNGTFGDGADHDVALVGYDFAQEGQELQLFPAGPPQTGWYRLVLAGDGGAGQPVLTGPSGVPLGKDADHPNGQDSTSTFEVVGEGRPGSDAVADDTATLAHDLGDLTPGLLVQATGAIGDDPFYDPTDPDVILNPAWDVDLYHFHVGGAGRFALTAEVFAGRFGSPLDPGISLFVRDPETGQLRFLDGNNNTRNPESGTNRSVPLYTDAALFDGLTEGDYFVAVSSGLDTPTPVKGREPGSKGIFDPNVSRSGTAGSSTGPYALNLLIQPDNVLPRVTSTTPQAGATLQAPPTELIVRFDEPMTLRRLSFLAYEKTKQSALAAVSVEGPDGTRYFPRLESFDESRNEAHFVLLDRLTFGTYLLRLSGPLGLNDRAENPLVGNDPGGDYLVPFTIADPPPGTHEDPLNWSSLEPNDHFARPQDLGILFPHEFQEGITITRGPIPAGADSPTDTRDFYRFQVIRDQTYGFTLTSAELSDAVILTLTDADGNAVPSSTGDGVRAVTAALHPGIYLLQVGTWSAERAARVGYQLRLTLSGALDNPPPLVTGPRSALQVRLASDAPSPDPEPVVQIVLPTPGETDRPDPSPDVLLVRGGGASSPGLEPPVQIVLPAARGNDLAIPAVVAQTDESTPVVLSTAAPASSGGVGTLPPMGTLMELGVGPLAPSSGTGRPAAPSLPERLAAQVTDSPRLVVAGAAQTPFLLTSLSSGDGETKTEPTEADATPPASNRTPEDVGRPGPPPQQIPQELPAVSPEESTPVTPSLVGPPGERPPATPSDEPAAPPDALDGVGGSDPKGKHRPVPSPTDATPEPDAGPRRFLGELGSWCSALVGLALAVRAYGRRPRAPALRIARRRSDEDRERAGGAT
jgi:hypothetical protein